LRGEWEGHEVLQKHLAHLNRKQSLLFSEHIFVNIGSSTCLRWASLTRNVSITKTHTRSHTHQEILHFSTIHTHESQRSCLNSCTLTSFNYYYTQKNHCIPDNKQLRHVRLRKGTTRDFMLQMMLMMRHIDIVHAKNIHFPCSRSKRNKHHIPINAPNIQHKHQHLPVSHIL